MGLCPNLSLFFVTDNCVHDKPLVLTIPFSSREYAFLDGLNSS
jgi:hypothetical protein